MQTLNNKLVVVVAAVVTAVVLLAFYHQFNQRTAQSRLSNYLLTYLLNTLETPMFSDESGVVNDRDAIINVGRKINAALDQVTNNPWYSGVKSCQISVFAVDGIEVVPPRDIESLITMTLPRNKIDRAVDYGISCNYRVGVYLSWAALIVSMFALIYFFIPYPLSPRQTEWMNKLMEQGYTQKQAFNACKVSSVNKLILSERQLRCFDALHDSQRRNFGSAMKQLHDPRIANLNENQVQWFVFAVKYYGGEVGRAIALAISEDVIEINLAESTLRIHGLEIEIKKTPLFYLAWYANKKMMGDGWLTNPQSNVPDKISGAELADLMKKYAGHGKAIDDLTEFGLRSKTLDQNRSKIKELIVSVLGEALAEPYLFEDRKDEDKHRMSYRLKTPSEKIRIFG